jgi:hypothetical protein
LFQKYILKSKQLSTQTPNSLEICQLTANFYLELSYFYSNIFLLNQNLKVNMKLESENSILIQDITRLKAVLSEKTSQM